MAIRKGCQVHWVGNSLPGVIARRAGECCPFVAVLSILGYAPPAACYRYLVISLNSQMASFEPRDPLRTEVMARFDSNEFGAGCGHAMNEVVAYGTAVVIRKSEDVHL